MQLEGVQIAEDILYESYGKITKKPNGKMTKKLKIINTLR